MSETPPEIDRQLHRWIGALLDGSITPEDRAALASRLDTDKAARRAYIDAVDMHCEIADVLHTETDAAPSLPIYREGCEPRQRSLRGAMVIAIGIAAAIALSAAAFAIYVFAFNEPAVQPTDPLRRGPAVATLLEASGTVMINDKVANQGDAYAAGSYSLASGSAEFMLTSGATVQMRGRSNLTVHSSMDVTLSRGAARFHCPESAQGFAVRLLDGHRVVDLGTSFSVFNERGVGTAVYVHDGVVVMDGPDMPAMGMIGGQLVALDTTGDWAGSDSFALVLDGDWDAPAAVAALLPHVLERDGQLVLHESFSRGDADGRTSDERAMRFDHGPMRNPVSLDGDHAHLTLAAWVKLDQSTAPLRVLAINQQWGPAGHFSWDIRDGNHLCLAVSGNGSPHYHSSIAFDASHFDRWLHVAVVYDSERAAVEHYVDGRLVSSESITSAMPLRPGALMVGQWKTEDPRPLLGAMDELLMINAALSAKQIESLYRMGSVESEPKPQGDLP